MCRYVPAFRLPNSSKWTISIGLLIKIIVGFFYLYLYTYHYGAGSLSSDSNAYMQDSKLLNEVFYKSPKAYFQFVFGLDDRQLLMDYLSETTHWDSRNFFNDTKNIIRLHSFIHFFSFNQVVVHLTVVVFIALMGLRLIVVTLSNYVKLSPTLIFYSLLLMPNLLFWTSGILKEPLILFSFGLLFYSLLGQLPRIKKGILFLLSLVLFAGIKPYLLLCILPAIFVYILFNRIRSFWLALGTLIIGVVLITLSFLTPFTQPLVNKISDQQFDFINIGRGGVFARADTCVYIIYGENMPYVVVNEKDSTVFVTKQVIGHYIQPYRKKDKKVCQIYPNEKPWKLYYDGEFCGSYIEINPIEQSGMQLIRNIPEALNNVFFRPFPHDPPHTKTKWITIIDSWGLLLIFLFVSLFFRRSLERPYWNIIVALIVFCIVLALLIGWTTPVLGAIVRYKLPIQLAMMIMTLIMFNPEKIKKWKNTF